MANAAKGQTSAEQRPALFNSSIAKGILILEMFDKGNDLSLTQLSEMTGLDTSAVQRFTATLVHLGYLLKDERTRRYSLAPRLLQLGSRYLRGNTLIERARAEILDCHTRTGETVNLAVPDQENVIITVRFRNAAVISLDLVVGSALPWHATALGQAITASLPIEEEKQRIDAVNFHRYARNTIMDRDQLAQRLAQVREDGFAVADQETYDGDISIAAAVFNYEGRPVAAAGVELLSSRWNAEDARQKFGPLVIELAGRVSSSYGARSLSARER